MSSYWNEAMDSASATANWAPHADVPLALRTLVCIAFIGAAFQTASPGDRQTMVKGLQSRALPYGVSGTIYGSVDSAIRVMNGEIAWPRTSLPAAAAAAEAGGSNYRNYFFSVAKTASDISAHPIRGTMVGLEAALSASMFERFEISPKLGILTVMMMHTHPSVLHSLAGDLRKFMVWTLKDALKAPSASEKADDAMQKVSAYFSPVFTAFDRVIPRLKMLEPTTVAVLGVLLGRKIARGTKWLLVDLCIRYCPKEHAAADEAAPVKEDDKPAAEETPAAKVPDVQAAPDAAAPTTLLSKIASLFHH